MGSLPRLSRDNKLVFCAMLIWGAGEGLYINIWPLYIRSLGADSTQIGLVLSLSGLAVTLAFIVGGYLADNFSRRRLLIISNLMGTASILVYILISEKWG